MISQTKDAREVAGIGVTRDIGTFYFVLEGKPNGEVIVSYKTENLPSNHKEILRRACDLLNRCEMSEFDLTRARKYDHLVDLVHKGEGVLVE